MRRRAGQRRERRERGAHGGRVGVVRVVEEERARGVAQQLAAVRRGAQARRRGRAVGRRDADREGDRRGREEVADLVRAPPPAGAPPPLPSGVARRNRLPSGSATTSFAVTSASPERAEPHDAAPVARGDRGDAGIVGVGDEGAARLQSLEDLGLAVGDRVERGEVLQVRRGDEQDRGDVGLEGARERREIARLREPHLAHHPLGRARQVDDRHRESDLAVLVAGRLLDGEAAREDRRREVLGRRLAGRARDGGQAERPSSSSPPRRGCSRASTGFGTITAGKPAGSPSARRSPSSAPAPRAAASRAKSCPSTRAPRMATKRSPGRTLRESTATPESAAAPSARRAGGRRDVGQGEVHARPASSAATLRSSKGISRAPMTCVVSWPLPAMTTTVPGLASSIAWRIASRRSAIFRYFVAPDAVRPASTSRRIASGSSERGLSEVAMAMSASRPGDLAHRRALAAVAVAAAPEHEEDLPVRQLAHGLRAAARARRACARSRRGSGTPGPPRRARGARARCRRFAIAAATSAGGMPRQRPAVAAPARFESWNRPSSGEAIGSRPPGYASSNATPDRSQRAVLARGTRRRAPDGEKLATRRRDLREQPEPRRDRPR